MKTRKMNTGKYIEINEMVETIKITKNHMKDEERQKLQGNHHMDSRNNRQTITRAFQIKDWK